MRDDVPSGADLHVEMITEDISFTAGDLYLAGVIKKPESAGPHPAVVFVHGSAAVNRECGGLYIPIWQRFIRAGYACVSWDKPGTGESKGSYDEIRLIHHRAQVVEEGINLLKKRSDIDNKRIGMWGLSQAGVVMPIVATETNDVSFMIAVGCPAECGAKQSAYLVKHQLLHEGLSEEESSYYHDCKVKRSYAQTYEEYLKYAEPLSRQPFVRDVLKWGGIYPREGWSPLPPDATCFLDPADYLAKITFPVLAIFGEKDTNVNPNQGVEGYKRALTVAGNKNFKVVLILGADHKICITETGSIKEQNERIRLGKMKYVPEYLDLMENWLKMLNKGIT